MSFQDSDSSEEDINPLDFQFKNFSTYGEKGTDGQSITLTNLDLWFEQAQIFHRRFSRTDTGILFNKFKKRTLTYGEFIVFLEEICKEKELYYDEVTKKLTSCGLPGQKKEENKDNM